MQFQEYRGDKTRKFLPAEPSFVCRTRSLCRSVPIPRNLFCPRKILSCTSVTFILTFHPNFHTNVLSHVFHMRSKLFVQINICIRNLVSVTLKKIYILFLFINIGIVICVRVILKKIKIVFIHCYLCCCKIPKGYICNSSNISDYVNIAEITSTQHYTRFA